MLWVGSAPHRPGDALGSGMRSLRAGCGAGAMRAALKPHAPFAPRYRSYSSSSSSRRHRPAPPPVNTAAPVLSMGGAAPPGPLGAGRGGISPAANGRPPERGCWRERHRGAPRYPHREGGGTPLPNDLPARASLCPRFPPQPPAPGSRLPPGYPNPLPCPIDPWDHSGWKCPLRPPTAAHRTSAPHLRRSRATPGAVGAVPPPVSCLYFLPMEALHAVRPPATKRPSVPPAAVGAAPSAAGLRPDPSSATPRPAASLRRRGRIPPSLGRLRPRGAERTTPHRSVSGSPNRGRKP